MQMLQMMKDEMAILVAGFLTIVFVISLGIIFYFLSTTSMGDPTWGHYAYLLAALQAVTAGAVGWLFGSQVHRGEADMAKSSMGKAEGRASTAEESAMQGKVLAAQVMAHAQLVDSMASILPQNSAQSAVDAHMKQLVAHAKTMIPD